MSVTIYCSKCGDTVPIPSEIASTANAFGVLCEKCVAEAQRLADGAKIEKQVQSKFARICPPCFLDTDPHLLPCKKKSEEAMLWRCGSRGLNLWGWPGTGKTRSATLILKREIARGRSVIALGPGDFRRESEDRQFRRSEWLKSLERVDILFLDDMDKMNLTREMEKDLFAVLSARMGRKPVLSTGNSDGEKLKLQFRLGEALVDRMRRYSESIHFPKPVDSQRSMNL